MATKSKSTAAAPPSSKSEGQPTPVESDTLASAVAKNLREATLVNVLQLGDLIQNRLGRVLRGHDLTLSQYHVLRILEHAGTALASLEVAARMPQVAPAITGLLTAWRNKAL